MSFPHKLHGLTTREAITDTIYRAVAAYDENDFELLKSAAHPDIIFEIPGVPTMTGLDEIKAQNFDKVGAMDTTHFVTNVRVIVDGEEATTAKVTANALAQHYPTGTGATDSERRLLAAPKYVVDLVKDEEDGLWKVKKWVMKIMWREGDMSVLF